MEKARQFGRPVRANLGGPSSYYYSCFSGGHGKTELNTRLFSRRITTHDPWKIQFKSGLNHVSYPAMKRTKNLILTPVPGILTFLVDRPVGVASPTIRLYPP